MAGNVTLKDYFRETKLFSNRVFLAVVITLVLTLTIIVRLSYLQIVDHEHFATLSHDNRVNITPTPPTRGLIYDRNGVLLAQNVPSFNLELVPELIKDLDATIAALTQFLPINDEDRQRFHKVRGQKPGFESIPLLFRLTDEQIAKFAINRHLFPGVDIVARLVRNYPLGQRAAHAIGYVGRINEEELRTLDLSSYSGTSHIGKVGIEKSYEATLHGKVGVRHIEINALGRKLRVLQDIEPTPGKNLFLTLDTELQKVAEEAMGANRGALVAIDPNNGDILAFASTPTYDPNPFVVGIDKESYLALQQSPDQPLFNRALRGQYPPGSTIKPFVGLAGLENNKISAESRIFCGGWYSLRGDSHRYRDWRRGGHGTTNITKAITESCDVYFYDLASSLGIDTFHNFLAHFGFGQITGVDIDGEAPALLPSREWKRSALRQAWYPGETLIAGIGQGYLLTTPLQLASATATMANHGIRMQPRMVRALQDPGSLVITPLEPIEKERLQFASAHHWEQIVTAMTEVVNSPRGTARSIGIDSPYLIAGKTGTAQVFTIKQDERYDATKIDKRLQDHALFIAFAPVEKPQIALAIIVENGGHGGSAAAPIARQVMDHYLLKQSSDHAQ